jgi:hypothetical protein
MRCIVKKGFTESEVKATMSQVLVEAVGLRMVNGKRVMAGMEIDRKSLKFIGAGMN